MSAKITRTAKKNGSRCFAVFASFECLVKKIVIANAARQ
jgi:hypothetical protein